MGWTNENKLSNSSSGGSKLRLNNSDNYTSSLYPYNINELIVFDISVSGCTIQSINVNGVDVNPSQYTNTGTRIYGSIAVNSQMYRKWGTSYKFMDVNCNSNISSYTINKYMVLTVEDTINIINSNHTLIALWKKI